MHDYWTVLEIHVHDTRFNQLFSCGSIPESSFTPACNRRSLQVAVQFRCGRVKSTDGACSWSRHPSYAGFFYWCLGTQLVLQNPISFIVFAVVLWRFFYYRIRCESAFYPAAKVFWLILPQPRNARLLTSSASSILSTDAVSLAGYLS